MRITPDNLRILKNGEIEKPKRHVIKKSFNKKTINKKVLKSVVALSALATIDGLGLAYIEQHKDTDKTMHVITDTKIYPTQNEIKTNVMPAENIQTQDFSTQKPRIAISYLNNGEVRICINEVVFTMDEATIKYPEFIADIQEYIEKNRPQIQPTIER